MRLFAAGLAHESSGFSPIPTSIENFRHALLHRPSRGEVSKDRKDSLERAFVTLGLERGYDVVESLVAAATPSGPLVKKDFEDLCDEIIGDLKAALPVDAVAIFLHGAQLAAGYDDCEGELLSRMRAVVGPDVPIGVEFDLHGNVTPAMIDNSDILAACKEYPHTDFAARAIEVLDILEQTVAGKAKPVQALYRLPMLGIFHTTRQPMRGLVDKLFELEKDPKVLMLSIAHGFPWADTPHTGTSIIAVTDNDPALAEKLAQKIGEELWAIKDDIAAPLTTINDALDEAFATQDGPVIIADTADNAGGGAASDSTFILRELIERNAQDTAIGMIWDPIAVDFAFAAGEGTTLPMRIGGKVSPVSGDPVDVIATVTKLTDNIVQNAFGSDHGMGKGAAIRVGGIDIVLAAAREQVHSPGAFESLGIDITKKHVVVVKSAQHFHARFSPFASKVIYAVGPGTTSVDFSTFTYNRLQRPIWPLDADAKLPA